jgi:hypothetical protein
MVHSIQMHMLNEMLPRGICRTRILSHPWCLGCKMKIPIIYLCLELHDLALYLHPTPSWQALDHITIA